MRTLALSAAVLAALVVPGAPAGIGITLVALCVAAAAATTSRRSLDLLLFGTAALALASVPSFLDARWIVLIDLFAAWLFATLAIAGPRVLAPLAPFAALPAIPAVLPESSTRAVPAFRGVVIGTSVAVPFAVLFLTADAAFAAIADDLPRPPLGSVPSRLIAFCVVLLAALGLALAARKEPAEPTSLRAPRLTGIEWTLPLVVLNVLFLAFVAVQLTVLFAGHDHVLRTSGLTYAEYARQGFWQLLAAAALTLVVVKGATLLAGPRTPAEQLFLRALLALLCALTIVIVASAFHRLRLYESAYGLTRLRLAAEALSLWLGGTFGLLLLVWTLRRATLFPRAVLAWAAAAMISFSATNPDGYIADRNVDRWRETGRIDLAYVSGLSADAAPALSRLPTRLRGDALGEITEKLSRDEPWSSANLSRRRARDLIELR